MDHLAVLKRLNREVSEALVERNRLNSEINTILQKIKAAEEIIDTSTKSLEDLNKTQTKEQFLVGFQWHRRKIFEENFLDNFLLCIAQEKISLRFKQSTNQIQLPILQQEFRDLTNALITWNARILQLSTDRVETSKILRESLEKVTYNAEITEKKLASASHDREGASEVSCMPSSECTQAP